MYALSLQPVQVPYPCAISQLCTFCLPDFVAGEIVEGVIGLSNTNTEKEFIVTLIEGSFR